MRNTTLCYIEKDSSYLMLHRIKKENDMKILCSQCLDIWDEMFEKQIGSIKKLSKEILDR